MSLTLGTLVSPPTSYNFDDFHTGITPQMYLNNHLDDCVIAARAHHTVRLEYNPGTPVLAISDSEISIEYHAEAGLFNMGIVVGTSLARWRDHGWQAGGQLRSIDSFQGPLSVTGAGSLSGDATKDIDHVQIKNYIIDHTGVQVEFKLPAGITVNDWRTFGLNAPWTDVSVKKLGERHVMLLIGYDTQGPIGITWGAFQHMSWAFLQTYCIGIYYVQKSAST